MTDRLDWMSCSNVEKERSQRTLAEFKIPNVLNQERPRASKSVQCCDSAQQHTQERGRRFLDTPHAWRSLPVTKLVKRSG